MKMTTNEEVVEGIILKKTVYKENDMIVMEPFDKTDFLAITDTINVVVKVPGANDDKYMEV